MNRSHGRTRGQVGNYLLDSLPEDERDELMRQLEPVALPQSLVLYPAYGRIDAMYFPIAALISWVGVTESGETVEAGVVGYEGMTGTPGFIGNGRSPYRVDVQLPGEALRVPAEAFRRFYEGSQALQRQLLRYCHTQMIQLSQSVVCNRFHTVEERLCRWLLVAHDRIASDEMFLTQEILAGMIGARRPAVSIVTGTLHTAGLLQARRGRITILDREGLENAACECYGIVRGAWEDLTQRAPSTRPARRPSPGRQAS